MIKIICTSNRDSLCKVKWPTKFISVPQKGDYIRGSNEKRAVVMRITHCTSTRDYYDESIKIGEAYIELYLEEWAYI